MLETNFTWGAFNGHSVAHAIDQDYSEIVHWKRKLFLLLSGKAGKDFIREQMSLLLSYAESKSLKRIALKAAMTIPSAAAEAMCLIHAKDHVKCIERQLQLRLAGNIDSLVLEG